MSQNVARGSIVMVDFPYSDRTGSTVRPALVVQDDGLNRQLDDTILAMITSSRRRMIGAATQLLIERSHPDFTASGLRLDSVIQCENLVTIDQALILRVIGSLSAATMQEIDICLKIALAIA
jgi:mRNA interferase MazF